jgi:hypothetical protein
MDDNGVDPVDFGVLSKNPFDGVPGGNVTILFFFVTDN